MGVGNRRAAERIPRDPTSQASLQSLFYWHAPLPLDLAGRNAARARRSSLNAALAHVPATSPDSYAIRLITREPAAPAPDCADFIARHGAELDPLIHAALLQRYALAILDASPGVGRGRRARRISPSVALEAAETAMAMVADEMLALTAICESAHAHQGSLNPTSGVREARAPERRFAGAEASAPTDPNGADAESLIPPEVHAELTITYIRAALAVGAVEAAREAADNLFARAEQITVPHVRCHALISIAVARLNDGRPDDALLPAHRARSLARRTGDTRGVWQAERIRAHAASITGRTSTEEATHAEVAKLSRSLADDLGTPAPLRAEATVAELESRSVLIRLGLSTSRPDLTETHARAALERVRRARTTGDAPVAQLWEYEVDARVARMILAGMPRKTQEGPQGRRAAPGSGPTEYDERRRDARSAIAACPETIRDRALWWNAYVDDRHAYLLAKQGQTARALRVARRAERAWTEIGDTEGAARCERLIASLR